MFLTRFGRSVAIPKVLKTSASDAAVGSPLAYIISKFISEILRILTCFSLNRNVILESDKPS